MTYPISRCWSRPPGPAASWPISRRKWRPPPNGRRWSWTISPPVCSKLSFPRRRSGIAGSRTLRSQTTISMWRSATSRSANMASTTRSTWQRGAGSSPEAFTTTSLPSPWTSCAPAGCWRSSPRTTPWTRKRRSRSASTWRTRPTWSARSVCRRTLSPTPRWSRTSST